MGVWVPTPLRTCILGAHAYLQVGLGGVEPPTLRLSGARSNQAELQPRVACRGQEPVAEKQPAGERAPERFGFVQQK